jgi:hypothetical protein
MKKFLFNSVQLRLQHGYGVQLIISARYFYPFSGAVACRGNITVGPDVITISSDNFPLPYEDMTVLHCRTWTSVAFILIY